MQKTNTIALIALLVTGALVGSATYVGKQQTQAQNAEINAAIAATTPVPMSDRIVDNVNNRIAKDFINHGSLPRGAKIENGTATIDVGTAERPCTISLAFNDQPAKQTDGKVLPAGWNAKNYTCAETPAK